MPAETWLVFPVYTFGRSMLATHVGAPDLENSL